MKMNLEETIMECVKDFKSVVDSRPDELITLTQFVRYWKKDKKGNWYRTDEKWNSGNTKSYGHYNNTTYAKYQYKKKHSVITLDFNNWIISNLPLEIRSQAKTYIDESKLTQKYYLHIFSEFKSVVDSRPDELITFMQFVNYWKKDTIGEWYKTEEKLKGGYPRLVGLYFNATHSKYQKEKYYERTTLDFDGWMISNLPVEFQSEAKIYIDETLLTQKHFLRITSEFKSVVDSHLDEFITLTQFVRYWKKDDKGNWYRTEEKKSGGVKPDGIYANETYRKYHRDKKKPGIILEFNDWFISKLPSKMQPKEKTYIDESLLTQKYFVHLYSEFRSVIDKHPDELITLTQFVRYWKKDKKENWYKTEEKLKSGKVKYDGLYYNITHSKHQSNNKKSETPHEFNDWFINQLPVESQPEASYYIKGGYLTDKLKDLK